METEYTHIKQLNPNLPFLVRGVDDVTPNIVATYGPLVDVVAFQCGWRWRRGYMFDVVFGLVALYFSWAHLHFLSSFLVLC